MKPKLVVEQKITAFVNRYQIFSVNDDGTKKELIAFAAHKRLAFKEKVSFFQDSSKKQLLFTFRAEKVLDVHGKYFVEDADGKLVGMFQKQFAESLLNSTWSILDANGNAGLTVRESNMALAIARRYIGWVPFAGELLEIATAFIRYHFSFRTPGDVEVGAYRKTTLIRDHYLLSMTEDAYTSQDWRVFASVAVALDALQSR
ncbi:MAG: hypothetical protein JWN33_24 [Candidatus Saccharibacteria bacterium]|nr:hypothetical protein [Candidatus Saccharibacteria bacterium]